MEKLVLLLFGGLISVIGVMNIRGNISTIHFYNRGRVREEDIPKYGKTVGTGTLIVGLSLIAAYFVSRWSQRAMEPVMTAGLVVGLGFILYGQFKYNGGIF